MSLLYKMTHEISMFTICITDNIQLNCILFIFQCETILEEFDEVFIKGFSKPDENLDINICTTGAELCNQTIQDDYEFETHEEL